MHGKPARLPEQATTLVPATVTSDFAWQERFLDRYPNKPTCLALACD